jgi:hypothetical protein
MAAEALAAGRERYVEPLRTHAFGIDIDSTFQAPGLPAGSARLPRTRLELATEEAIAARWQSDGAERLDHESFSDARSRPDRTIDRSRNGDYLLYARHFGTALVSPRGDHVICAPPAVAAWRWQRFLVGRVLPWAALLRGRELLHASAIRIGDRAVAIVADTGHGKTSLAARLLLRGGGFITDDVLALSDGGDGILAHPGPAIVALRPAEREALEPAERRRLGRVLGRSGKTYVAVERESGPVPLGALYFLQGPARGGGYRFEPGIDPRRLLGSTFIASVDSERRLVSLLDLCARLEAAVPIWRVPVDYSQGAGQLAEAIWHHATGDGN